jgi:hypothetical protein
VSVRHKGEGRIVGSWVMGKEKSDTPHKRAGTAFDGRLDRHKIHDKGK